MNNNLISEILAASNKIHQATIKGGGNYLVTSPSIAELFNKINRPDIRKKKINKILDK